LGAGCLFSTRGHRSRFLSGLLMSILWTKSRISNRSEKRRKQ
jgi:hypothetical protein